MYIVVETWYPFNKGEEVRDKFLEVTKEYPEDPNLAKRIILAFRAVKDGINALVAWDVKKGKYEEAVLRISRVMGGYSEIEGHKWEMRAYITLEEGMSLVQ